MFVIGLTGGIASGKSTVSETLASLGAVIIDADAVAHEIVEPGEKAFLEIVETFGSGVVGPDGALDRAELGKRVFNDPLLRGKLNQITHPRVGERFKEKMGQLPPGIQVVVWDVPLLFESGMDKQVDEAWLVWVDEKTQIARLMHRNGYTREEAQARIRAQMPLREKMKRADRLIDNRGTVEETRALVTSFFIQLSSILPQSLI